MSANGQPEDELRRHLRAPVTLEVRYRTTGSFLVSYSLNLSVGGLLLETNEAAPPVGTALLVRFTVPGAVEAIETQARVVWVREPTDVGARRSLGLQFEGLEQQMGVLIDGLVRRFEGLTLVAVAARGAPLERLSRYLRSALACTVVQVASDALGEIDATVGAQSIDLLAVDLDSTGPAGVGALSWARSMTPKIPAVVVADHPEAVAAAELDDAATVIRGPLSFEKVRRCVLDVLARPLPGVS
ncbi:MAG: PilZ domain-containing protein [Proteobacteria bacterium]|nr:PilZ domain-containing protein [Pseudomonadota bacterium]